MGDVKLRADWHAETLASGRTIAPGEVFDDSALNLDDPIDERLVEEGLVIEATIGGDPELKGKALDERARELGIPNRTTMDASEVRAAVARAEAEQAANAADQPEPPVRVGGGEE